MKLEVFSRSNCLAKHDFGLNLRVAPFRVIALVQTIGPVSRDEKVAPAYVAVNGMSELLPEVHASEISVAYQRFLQGAMRGLHQAVHGMRHVPRHLRRKHVAFARAHGCTCLAAMAPSAGLNKNSSERT
jgi:hypothetical protein